jgi:6-phospho-beta-glucosidase
VSVFVRFPEDFYWGCASSSTQSEGKMNKANESTWDYWHSIEPERFFGGVGPEVTCNTYVDFRKDIRLMKELKLNSFRTSIQWGRLIKDFDSCETDEDGVRFYNEYIDELIANGIEPFITLFHFDMPMSLQTRGGWASKEVVELYVKYAKTAFRLFGDRVKKWFTFNEPIVPVEGGYLYRFHYPNEVHFKKAVQAAYTLLCSKRQTGGCVGGKAC